MAHTKGPWAVNCDTGDRRMPYWVGPADGGELIAHLCESAGDHTVQRDNARLIASAPALLAALEQIAAGCAVIANHLEDCGQDGIRDFALDNFRAARAAIAAARGEYIPDAREPGYEPPKGE